MTVQRLTAAKIGEAQGSPRVWLEGKYLLKAEFMPGKFMLVEYEKNKVTLTMSELGTKKVSSQKPGETK